MSVTRGIRRGVEKKIFNDLIAEKYNQAIMEATKTKLSRKDRRAMAKAEAKDIEKSFFAYAQEHRSEPAPKYEYIDKDIECEPADYQEMMIPVPADPEAFVSPEEDKQDASN
jgi:hypothetical protein